MVLTQTTIPTTAGLPWLSLLVATPLVVALLLGLVRPLRPAGREIALGASLMVLLGVLLAALTGYDPAAAPHFQLGETYPWIPAVGLSWAVGVNGLGLVMIILAAALTPLVILASWNESGQAVSKSGYAGWILALESCMILLFSARDLLLFYIAFEAMLIPLYFLIGRFGHGCAKQRRHAAIKFLLYSLAGGLIMLWGILALYRVALLAGAAPESLFLLDQLSELGLDNSALALPVMLSFFIAFAIKAPLVPVHTWLPSTAQVARAGTSVLLVGVLDKVGTWGMLMFCWGLFPAASRQIAPVIVVLAVISILWGALGAIYQKDLLRLVSFTSISHFGFMVMALYVGSLTAIEGAMLYMVAHGVSIAGLFLLSGWLTERGGTQEIAAYRGFQRVTPVLAGLFLISGLAAIALPGLSGFLPEYLILLGSFSVKPAAALVSVLGVVLAAVYVLLPYQKIFTGPVEGSVREVPDLRLPEKLAIAPIILAMFGLGFYPGPALELLKPDAQASFQSSWSEVTSVTSAPMLSLEDAAQGDGEGTDEGNNH